MRMERVKKHISLIVILLVWALALLGIVLLSEKGVIRQNFHLLLYLSFPFAIPVILEQKLAKVLSGLIAGTSGVLLTLWILKDQYSQHEFFSFHLETLILFMVMIVTFLINSVREQQYRLWLELLISLALTIFLGGIFQKLLHALPYFSWKVFQIPTLLTVFYLLKRHFDVSKWTEENTPFELQGFMPKFLFFILSAAWCYIINRLGDGHFKFHFLVGMLLLSVFVVKKFRWFLMVLVFLTSVQTWRQARQMNLEVSLSFIVVLATAVFLYMASLQLKKKWAERSLQFMAILVFTMSFVQPTHLYYANLQASKQSLVTIATRLGMYNQAKIVPVQNEISNEAKILFSGVLFTLIKYHPLKSYQDIFQPDLKNIFANSRPMYTDETYDKFRNRMYNVLSRLNIAWNVRNPSNGHAGKQVYITSVDSNSQMTKIYDDDYVSNRLYFQFPLKDGRLLKSQMDMKSGTIFFTLDGRALEDLNFGFLIDQHVPPQIKERELKIELQPNEMSRSLEVPGLRLRIKIDRLIGRKSKEGFQYQTIAGKVFIKHTSAK